MGIATATQDRTGLQPAGQGPIIDAMQEAVVTLDLEHRVLSWSAGARRLFGWTAEEARGQSILALLRPEGMRPAFEELVGALLAGKALSETAVHHRKDGSSLTAEVTFALLRDAAGAPGGVLAVGRDVTEVVRAEQARQEGERRLALVLEGSRDGYWDWDVPTGRVWYSDRWATMLGYDRAELSPHVSTWELLVHPRDRERVMAEVEALLAGRLVDYECEHRMRRKDGTWAWILDRGKVVERAADGRPLRAAGTHTDITARKEAEEALHAANADNQRLVADLRAALHQVKTLTGLIPICMYCKRVRDDHGYWAQLEEYLTAHTDAELSHGLCPTCYEAHRPPGA